MATKPVPANHVCDSLAKWPLHDARGIFCCYVCRVCEQEKRARFRPEIFNDPAYESEEEIEEV